MIYLVSWCGSGFILVIGTMYLIHMRGRDIELEDLFIIGLCSLFLGPLALIPLIMTAIDLMGGRKCIIKGRKK